MREISEPLEVIDDLFKAHADSGAGTLPPREWNEKAHFIRVLQLQDEDNFKHIPCLNELELGDVAHQSLVRYRCMVQDVWEPEVFAAVLLQKGSDKDRFVTTKYREICRAENVTRVGNRGLVSRGVYYCVPMPGESAWAQGRSSSKVPRSSVREKSGEEIEPQQKRRKGCAKITDCCGTKQTESLFSGSSICCVVKLYDEQEVLRVCETVEILGVFCREDPAAPSADLFPGHMIPRVHGLFVRKLPFFNPMLPFSHRWLSEGRLMCTLQRRFASTAIAELRQLAIKSLQSCLAGDILAAEYVLALLVARVYGNNGSRSLGHWSLNIDQWPEVSVTSLVQAVSNLVPRVVHLTVTAESLSTKQWKSQKDVETNFLQSGELQLAPGTLLILDETNWQLPRKLDEAAFRGIRAIRALDSEQMLLIDFDTYEVQVPLEVNCLYISRNASILKSADIVLPLRPQTNPDQNSPEASAESFEAVRFLLGIVSHRTQPLRLQQIMGAFSEDYAHLRDEFREMDLGQQTLHVWVALARACCFTHGEEEMTLQRWRMVFALEQERCRRCTEGLRERAKGQCLMTQLLGAGHAPGKDKALLENAYEIQEESRMEEENAQGEPT
eukprot:Skav227774  [mRNA]  locus=scaffold1237:79728:82242:+ [translate_table: standard]